MACNLGSAEARASCVEILQELLEEDEIFRAGIYYLELTSHYRLWRKYTDEFLIVLHLGDGHLLVFVIVGGFLRSFFLLFNLILALNLNLTYTFLPGLRSSHFPDVKHMSVGYNIFQC